MAGLLERVRGAWEAGRLRDREARAEVAAAIGNVVRASVETLIAMATWGHADRQITMTANSSPLPPPYWQWTARPDACPICLPLAGRRARQREELPAIPGGTHPNCRCVCLLVT